MKAIELLSEELPLAPGKSGHRLGRVGDYQYPLNQWWVGLLCRLAVQLKALRNKLDQPPKKIFIVEDHPTFRQGLIQSVNDAEDLTVCGAAGAVGQALAAIARTKPDLVLADIGLPGKRGLQLIKDLRSTDRSVKLLIISGHNNALHAARVIRSGGDGYMMNEEDSDEIVDAIHDILEGHTYVSEEVMARRPSEQPVRNFQRESPSRGVCGPRKRSHRRL